MPHRSGRRAGSRHDSNGSAVQIGFPLFTARLSNSVLSCSGACFLAIPSLERRQAGCGTPSSVGGYEAGLSEMTPPHKKPGVAFWATVVVVVALMAYPLSSGPVGCIITASQWDHLYSPLIWV